MVSWAGVVYKPRLQLAIEQLFIARGKEILLIGEWTNHAYRLAYLTRTSPEQVARDIALLVAKYQASQRKRNPKLTRPS